MVVSGTSGLTVVGTKGTIKYGPYCQCPSTVEVELSPENGRTDNGRTNTTKIIDFPLPDIHTHRADSKVKYRFTRSAGLQYSAAALHRCIRAGLLECPQYTTEGMRVSVFGSACTNCSSFTCSSFLFSYFYHSIPFLWFIRVLLTLLPFPSFAVCSPYLQTCYALIVSWTK